MMPWVYLLVMDLACIASGTWLVHTEHYGWAWIPFALAASQTLKATSSRDGGTAGGET